MKDLVYLISFCVSIAVSELNNAEFPEDFMFGAATSAYQIEGAWNKGGKGVNIWDHWTHHKEGLILDGSNGDVACDSYYKTAEDVALMKKLGIQIYRFSMSWSRILPTGYSNVVNKDGLNYYKILLKQLRENKITPMVTMFHFDLPKSIYDIGGWTNKQTITYFVEYAKILFKHFADKVDYWLTIHDPLNTCIQGEWISGIGDYLCMHNLLKAHAAVYHLYKQYNIPKGKISINFRSHFYEPKSQSTANKEAAERALQFYLGWYANPIYSENGDYPEIMKDMIQNRSMEEGFPKSRLPEFTEEEVNYIKGTSDFFALTHYTTFIAANKAEDPIGTASRLNDTRVTLTPDGTAAVGASEWLRVVPRGFREILNWIKKNYGDEKPIFVTGNGYSDNGEIDDVDRIEYHQLYLSALLDAIHTDKVNVKAYIVWSLMDSFEWIDGYAHRFGLYHVNFKDPYRTRTPKASVKVYKDIIFNKALNSTKNGINK